MKIASPFFVVLKNYANQFEAQIKLQMLMGLKRFYTLKIEECLLGSGDYHRTFCRIMDKIQNLYFEGMAEGKTEPEARLLAYAEAYERACFCEFKAISQRRIDGARPYGLGVGFRKSTAIRRAYGEYIERALSSEVREQDCEKQISEIQDSKSQVNKSQISEGEINNSEVSKIKVRSDEIESAGSETRIFRRTLPRGLGSVYVVFVVSSTRILGSGYGLNVTLAIDSAQRSVLRQADNPQGFPQFEQGNMEAPSVSRITVAEQPWLECYFVGHLK